jgi:hypothetical protein
MNLDFPLAIHFDHGCSDLHASVGIGDHHSSTFGHCTALYFKFGVFSVPLSFIDRNLGITRYLITSIQILIAGLVRPAWITSAYAPSIWITDLLAIAEHPVVRADRIVGRVHTSIVDLVAGINGAVDAVITVDRRTRLAGAGSCVTGLRTVAEKSIIAVRVNRALGWRYTLAGTRIALLIWGTIHRRKDATGDRLATVGCAQIAIVTDQRFTRLAIVDGIADLCAVADVAVVTIAVVGCIDTGISAFVAGIVCAADAVIAIGRCAGLTGSSNTDLGTVAEQSIIAVAVNYAIGNRLAISVCCVALLTIGTNHRIVGATGQCITAVVCAQIPIVAIQRCSWLAIVDWVAGLVAVADTAVVTIAVVGCIDTGISALVAGIVGTADAVIAIDQCAVLAIVDRIADLCAVAEKTVVAGSVIRRVCAGIIDLVATIDGAADAVITVGRRTGLASACGRVTGLQTVAELTVVAV